MTVRDSISRRLIVTLTAALISLWLMAMVLAALLIQHELNEAFDSALMETAQRMLPVVIHDLSGHEGGESMETLARVHIGRHREYLTYQVRDAGGNVVMRSHDAAVTAFDVPLQRGFADWNGLRLYTEEAAGRGIFIQVAEPLWHRRESALEAVVTLFIPLLLLIPLSLVLVRWLVRRGLRPLVALGRNIAARDDRNLQPLDDRDLPRELQPIVEAINHFLERIHTALEAEKTFTANSAHELRTPVAGALAQTQRLLSQLEDGPVKQRVAQIETALRRLRNLSGKLLQLSRAEQSDIRPDRPVDLMPAVHAVVDELNRGGKHAGRVRLDTGGHSELHRHMDPDALAIALRNVLENALLHGDAAETVHVSIDAGGALHVVNGGPVIAAGNLARLRERFRRGDTEAAGSGIGLAITDTVMQRAGGRLELRSPAGGRDDGVEVILDFN